ncbi:hypothetical protein CDL12_07208 [Handroanthus impetiginosus]|uniref:BHLH domain-containing protein n=1 Tax=Handroanthus impetiginosus TaxID=429701 RepID=A0A2G9HRG7_9LAMI|nr:hypothetical protein CDL12_07208 [Handroanthus impetiginosus]
MGTLDSAKNSNKKKKALTNCLIQRNKIQGVCGKNCSSPTVKLTNRDHITHAKLHTKATTLINAFTFQTEFQPAQPNSRLSDAHDTSPDQQCNTVKDNFSTFTASTKLKLHNGTSLEPARTASSESSPCAPFNPNKINTKGYYRQAGDSESHCNANGESNTLATAKGVKRKRAAQVHKLSDTKRRDKINKRLRALQDLIPNCTKRDKVSVLDETIEYLKSLRLQLQIMPIFAGLCVPSTQMMSPSPAYYPTVGSSIALTFGMAAGFPGHRTRLQMLIPHHR